MDCRGSKTSTSILGGFPSSPWGGIKAGSGPGNIYLLDALATFCDLTGIQIPSTCEGMSFKPVLMGKKEKVREVLYGPIAEGPSRASRRSARATGN